MDSSYFLYMMLIPAVLNHAIQTTANSRWFISFFSSRVLFLFLCLLPGCRAGWPAVPSQRQADLESPTLLGATPLHVAALAGQLPVVRALVQARGGASARLRRGLGLVHCLTDLRQV